MTDEQLAGDARAGRRDATEALVRRYTPIIRRHAARYHSPGRGDDLEDLVQIGLVGMLEALSRFDETRGSFKAFAMRTISGTIKRHFRDRGWRVRVPRPIHDAWQKMEQSLPSLRAVLGREPTDAELAEATGLDVELVRESRGVGRAASPLSLQGTAGGEEGGSLSDALGGDDPGLERAEVRAVIGNLTDRLAPREREMIARRFGLDQTQLEIARMVGVSQMHVSRMLRLALRDMGRLDEVEAGAPPTTSSDAADGAGAKPL